MKIIDAHIHLSNIESFRRTADELSFVDYSAAGLKKEFDACGVVAGIGMGVTEQTAGAFPDQSSPNPMGLDLEAQVPDFLMECVGINPVKLAGAEQAAELARIDARLGQSEVAGIKLYAGYYHYYVTDAVYEPVYELAAHYGLPVVIHTGDTYATNGMLKYSHPLTVDELAVTHRRVNFMICHIGDPWVMDAAEVVAKNSNVFADLSGLLVGDKSKFKRFEDERLYMDHLRRGLVYTDDYSKYLFGTDWPLASVSTYIEFVKKLVPEASYEQVFYDNALRLFPRLKTRLEHAGHSGN